jgi:uncharacterized protein YukE
VIGRSAAASRQEFVMSPQAIADPEELERFASMLQRYTEMLSRETTSLNSQFSQLGETWKDQEHAKFAEEYRQTITVLQRFVASANQQIPFLRRKATRLREYLSQR